MIEAGAIIGNGSTIGPYCIVGGNVVIGDDCTLAAHVNVAGHTTIGARTVISPFASLGGRPQSAAFRGGATRLVVGSDCDIRESVTMSTGTEDGGGLTEIKDRGLFMANSHVGHDCRLGSDVVLVNCAGLGGHWRGCHPVRLVAGSFARLSGINAVGMRRRKFSSRAISAVRAAYRLIFLGNGIMSQRLDDAEIRYRTEEHVAQIVAFIRTRGRRPICQAGRTCE
jgi:UDP-N-acetylglucosamine acyltransferase